jgi:signal transduction histidine kinase/ligand-binding sensor domain-containing protein
MQYNSNILIKKTVRLLCVFNILAILFLVAGNLHAQEKYFFEKLSVSDGLSNSLVFETYQDHLGFLWVGTLDGLNRYDGYEFKTYKNVANDSLSLPANFIQAIYEDRNNDLWVGTIDQISKYNRQKDNFTSYNLVKGPNVNPAYVKQIFEDSKNRLWVASDQVGVQLFDRATNTFKGIDFTDYTGNTISHYSETFFKTIIELKNGNIIAASPSHGVFIYNAALNEFQAYLPSPELNKNRVREIYEDRSGKLWLGATDNIFIYDPASFTMRTIDLREIFPEQGANNRYGDFYEVAGDKIMFISSFGLLESDLKATSFSVISNGIDNIRPQSLFRDTFGIYWISTSGSGLYKLDPTKKPFQFLRIGNSNLSSNITKGVLDITHNTKNRDELIISLYGQGIYKYSQAANSFSKIQNESGLNLVTDNNENVWFTSDSLLYKLNLKTGNKESFLFPNFKYTRAFDVNDLKFGPDKKLWISGDRGIETFDPETEEFGQLPSIMNKKASSELMSKIRGVAATKEPIASILKAGEGVNLSKEFKLNESTKILMLTLGEGRLQNFDPNMFDFGTIENSNGETLWASDITQNSFHDGGGYKNRLSMGTLELPAGTYKITFQTDIGHNYGAFNVEPPIDSDWYGIQVFQVDENDYEYLEDQIKKELDNTYLPPFEIVNDLEFSEKYVRSAWIGTNGAALIKLNLTDNSYKRYNYADDGGNIINPFNSSFDVLEDKDGIVWIITRGGLLRFDPEMESFKIIEGLPSNQISFMIQDLNGNLWFGTPGGISMLDKTNKNTQLSFIQYDNTDGINNMPLNNSLAITDEGKIFYGGIGGLNTFFPGNPNKTLPKPVLTNLMVSGESLNEIADEIGLDTNISEAKSVTLPYNYNNLSLEFAAVHFSRPEKNKLAFMLDGIDEDWNLSNRKFASYSNLPPGDYEFKIKGANGDGVWNPEISSLKIFITPPWWKTWWAYSLYGILLLFVLWQLHKFQRERTLRLERQKTQQKDLEQAKKIEKAYAELQATQSQLIQSEKMASLGELTAGIAHEIQNPLNFVNNFSEVNIELIDEMLEELKAGNNEEAIEISNDIKENEKKITHHGKRADSIVKGMLKHSRNTSGEREPTNINAIAEEYLRLAYHGLRAKDKSFNATLNTDFDESIGNINVAGQDIGRVILNLITNALHAISPSSHGSNEETVKDPTIWLSTKQIGDDVLIKIKDNGSGIPNKILDKIFQPFFTTKASGQGTGLGLSMSYDIIKSHGGELKVESKEGEGTTFTIVIPKSEK